ncbi:MAG: sigma-70 family RNA polymerase sigma factor [Thermoleophilia bacterium]|nr:sigma-70 family RNA polymerase sigma factor [Thermoleophilia bacterium]
MRARDELLLAHHGLVVDIATSLTKDSLEREELIQVGTLALMGALDRFDRSRGARLSSYAFEHIRWAMIAALKEVRGDPVVAEDRLERETWQEFSREEGIARKVGRKPSADQAEDWR